MFNRKLYTLFLLIPVLLVSNYINAQQPIIQTYTTEEGLSQNSILFFLQDSKGLLWVGTQFGLNRFNASEFRVFTASDGLKGNRIYGMAENPDGSFYVATDMGLNLLNTDQTISDIPYPVDFLPSRTRAIAKTSDGNIYVGSDQGIRILKNGKFESYEVIKNIKPVRRLYVEPGTNVLWIGTFEEGCYRFDNGDLVHFDTKDGLQSNQVNAFLKDSEGTVWIGTTEGIVKFKNGKLSAYRFPEKYLSHRVEDILEIEPGSFAVALNTIGIVRITPTQTYLISRLQRIPSNSVICMALTPEKDIWVGTYGSGFFRYGHGKFTSYNEMDGMPTENIISIYKDEKETLWLGSYGQGIIKFENGKFKKFAETGDMASEFVSSITGRNGIIYAGTQSGKVYEIQSNRIKNVYNLDNRGKRIFSLLIDDNSTVWVGTTGSFWTLKNGKLKNVAPSDFPSRSEIRSIKKIDGNRLIAVSDDQIYSIEGGGNITNLLRYQDVGNNKISDAVLAGDSTFWVSTYAHVLYQLKEDKASRKYKIINEFVTDIIYDLVADESNRIWATGANGVFLLDSDGIHRFNTLDGLFGDQCSKGSVFYTPEGDLWVGGGTGLSKINTRLYFPDKTKSNLKLTAALFDEDSFLTEENPEIPFGTKSFRFRFTSLSYSNPKKMQFKYQLLGLEEDWSQPTKSRQVDYTNLAPGDYEFKVLAINNDGFWNTEPVVFKFKILSPLWMQTWFIVVSVSAVILLILGFVQIRIRYLTKQSLKLENLVTIRTKELDDKNRELEVSNQNLKALNHFKTKVFQMIAHDLKNPLTVITTFSELALTKKNPENENVISYVEKIRKTSLKVTYMISTFLDAGTLEHGEIKLILNQTDISLILQETISLYEDEVSKKELKVKKEIQPDLPLIELDAFRFFEIFDNLISNAIKYSDQKTEIEIKLKMKTSEILEFTISNSGNTLTEIDKKMFEANEYSKMSGRPTAGESSFGIGLSIVHQLITLHKGKVFLDIENDGRNTFGFDIPVKN